MSEQTLHSPNHHLTLTFSPDDSLTYHITFHDRPVILPSRLGLTFQGLDLASGWAVTGTRTAEVRETITPPFWDRDAIANHYNEMAVDLANGHRRLTLTFRAFDGAVAWRYTLAGFGAFEVVGENTQFSLPAGSMVYYERGTEGEYLRVPAAEMPAGSERPLTVEFPGGYYGAIHEADLCDYPMALLSPAEGEPGTLVTDLQGAWAGHDTLTTPWRVVFAADHPGRLMENNVVIYALNPPPAIRDTSYLRPGKAIREVTLSTEGGLACVDFAAARGLQYVEYDAGWYGPERDNASDASTVTVDPDRIKDNPQHGGLDLPEVIRHAHARGIGVFLYVNRRELERNLAALLPIYKAWGVDGLKFGFVNVGSRHWSRWLCEAVALCAEHGMMVDIHDSYRPTGLSRTYPNLLTQEGIRGNEHMPTARHNVTLPFTRCIAGPADYTYCIYDRRLQNTRAHQFAMTVAIFSPLQFVWWYDRPAQYGGEPEFEFFERVPTVWSETRVLDGAIGEYAVIARRKGAEWYVGCLTNEAPRTLRLPLDFLGEGAYTAARFCDAREPAPITDVHIVRERVTREGALEVDMRPRGGQAIILTPEG